MLSPLNKEKFLLWWKASLQSSWLRLTRCSLFAEGVFYLLPGRYQGSPQSCDVTLPFIVPSLQALRPLLSSPFPVGDVLFPQHAQKTRILSSLMCLSKFDTQCWQLRPQQTVHIQGVQCCLQHGNWGQFKYFRNTSQSQVLSSVRWRGEHFGPYLEELFLNGFPH